MNFRIDEIQNGFLVYDSTTCEETYHKTFDEAIEEIKKRQKGE